MKFLKDTIWLIMVCVSLPGLVLPGVSAAQVSPLADRVEAVIVKGELLPSDLRGARLESYRLFVSRAGSLVSIPMQIDERGEDGTILVKEGPQNGKGDQKFDARDELVFMARDTGAPIQDQSVEGCQKTAVITVIDDKTAAKGHVLLAQCENPPALAAERYVRCDLQNRTIITDRYRVGWKIADVYYYDYITVNNGPDILDRLKVRCTLGKWGITYTFDEEFFDYRLIGITNGPVRVIWLAENFWSLGSLGKLPIPVDGFFYPEYVSLHNSLDARFNPAVFGLDFNVIIAHDLDLDRGKGYKVCANVIPECIPLANELTTDEVGALASQDMSWGGVSGPEGALITHFLKDPGLRARTIGVYQNDEKYEDPPEYVRGSSPLLGFNVVNWREVKRDIYDLTFYHFFMDQYTTGEFERFDRMNTNPLAVSVK